MRHKAVQGLGRFLVLNNAHHRHRIDPVKEQKTKRDEQVAKHMKFNIPCKNAIIKGRKVEYFPGKFDLYFNSVHTD